MRTLLCRYKIMPNYKFIYEAPPITEIAKSVTITAKGYQKALAEFDKFIIDHPGAVLLKTIIED